MQVINMLSVMTVINKIRLKGARTLSTFHSQLKRTTQEKIDRTRKLTTI